MNSICNCYISKLECCECYLDFEIDCKCFDSKIESISVRCMNCRNKYEVLNDKPSNKDLTRTMNKFVTKCRHYDNAIEFLDGTIVYASSMHDRTCDERSPDLGVYLDTGWKPTGLAFFIDWPDYEIPDRMDAAAYTLIESYKMAKFNKLWVEVSCIGGHGRTGTALACYGILAGMKADESIKYIRNCYCINAIETKEQEWFVKWFEVFINGGKIHTSDKPRETFYYDEPLMWQEYDYRNEPTKPYHEPKIIFETFKIDPVKKSNDKVITVNF